MMMKVWQVRPVWYIKRKAIHIPTLLRSGIEKSAGCWVSYDDPEQLARDNFPDLEPGDLMEVRVAEMTQEAFDALPEHAGW